MSATRVTHITRKHRILPTADADEDLVASSVINAAKSPYIRPIDSPNAYQFILCTGSLFTDI